MARAALDLGSSSSWGLWEDLWLPDETAVRLLEGALAALPEDDSVLRARVLGQLAVQFRTEDELHSRSEQALQMARRLQDPLALTDALGARLVACRMQTSWWRWRTRRGSGSRPRSAASSG